MIYNDQYSFEDTEECPGSRPDEKCLNCGKYWIYHYNWGCDDDLYFSETSENNRYLTQSMINSITPKQMNINLEGKVRNMEINLSIPDKKDISDWRSWANNYTGECACGIKKTDCDYHK